ncbi:MAG: hypothetical protein MJA30_36405, partial [Cytophagales bacterium]|nr:hypothetical protein [Cytophagales bacterium]
EEPTVQDCANVVLEPVGEAELTEPTETTEVAVPMEQEADSSGYAGAATNVLLSGAVLAAVAALCH